MDSSSHRSPNSPSSPNGGTATFRELLRSRQQNRHGVRGNPKSCLPCRERKVKCDKELPCSTCDKRGHPDLCEYEKPSRQSLGTHRSPRSARSAASTARPSDYTPNIPIEDRTQPTHVQDVTQGHPTPSTSSRAPSISAAPLGPQAVSANGSPPAHHRDDHLFLADNSMVVNMARQRSLRSRDDPARQSAFETGVLPLLGVNGGPGTPVSTYQFLPSDQEIVRLFGLFRRRVHPFHVITFNLDKIEERVCRLISARSEIDSHHASESVEDPRWLSLLHALLAAAVQFSDRELRDRVVLSQKHMKHAFDLLASTDYLARPSKEAVQTLLILGNVLQNDMKPQAAWVLGGTTIRVAQCLGLYRKSSRQTSTSVMPDDEAKHLRLAIVWQDSLLALAFGRPPASHEMDLEDDLPPLGGSINNEGLSYLQSMNWLCHITLRHLSSYPKVPNQPMSALSDMKSIEASLAPHLIDPKKSTSIMQMQEYHAFELHRHFVISTLCRPFVSSSGSLELSDSDRPLVLDQFQDSLRRSVRAYARLRSLAPHARRSWAFIHNGLTSILLLSLMRETRCLPETRTLQDELIASLSEDDKPASSPDSSITGHLSDTLKKALKALKTLRTLTERDMHTQNQALGAHGIEGQMPSATENRPDMMEGGDLDPAVEITDFWAIDSTDWSFPMNFALSPLGAFDYIMSDQTVAGDEFLPNIA